MAVEYTSIMYILYVFMKVYVSEHSRHNMVVEPKKGISKHGQIWDNYYY